MVEELKEIRAGLAKGVKSEDLYYIELVIKRLDKVIYTLVKNGNTVKLVNECQHNFVSSVAYKGAKICTKCDLIK